MLQMQKVLSLKDELKKKNPKLYGNYMLTEKYDGWYVQIHYHPELGWDSPVSSAGRMIPSLEWVKEVANATWAKPTYPVCLLAEAYLEDTPFYITNGKLNRSIGDYHLPEVAFAFHDFIDLRRPDMNALTRSSLLKEFIAASTVVKDNWKIAPILHFGEYDHDEWYRQFDTIVSRGGEGIIAKRSTGGFSAGKRNADLIRIKLECTVEAVAMDLEHTIGEKGNPGLTLISLLPNGNLVRTVINKHEDQDLFIREKYSLMTKVVVQLKAMEEYEDGNLRQPVFQCIRHDKLPTDILK